MIDYQKVETFRALSEKQGKIELEKYALELGHVVKRSMSFDNMVKSLEDFEAAKTQGTDPVELTEQVEPTPESVEPVKEISTAETLEVPMDVEPVEEVPMEQVEVEPEFFAPDASRSMAFDLMGSDYPWAWNMSNVNNRYWFSCIDSAQYADLKSEKQSDFKKFVFDLMKKSGMGVVVREPRNSMFVHATKAGIHESNMITL